MTLKEYAALVQQTRAAQIAYFRSSRGEQSVQKLDDAKRLEKRLDDETRAILDDRPTLF